MCVRKTIGPYRLPPWRKEPSHFRAQNSANVFHKSGFPGDATLKVLPTNHTTHAVPKIQNRPPQLTLCLEGQRLSCALCPPLPPSWFYRFSGPRSGIFTWSNPASGPEFLSPLNPMHPAALLLCLPSFPHNHPFPPGEYMQ